MRRGTHGHGGDRGDDTPAPSPLLSRLGFGCFDNERGPGWKVSCELRPAYWVCSHIQQRDPGDGLCRCFVKTHTTGDFEPRFTETHWTSLPRSRLLSLGQCPLGTKGPRPCPPSPAATTAQQATHGACPSASLRRIHRITTRLSTASQRHGCAGRGDPGGLPPRSHRLSTAPAQRASPPGPFPRKRGICECAGQLDAEKSVRCHRDSPLPAPTTPSPLASC